MSSVGSVTKFLEGIKRGEPAAAQFVWDRFARQLLRIIHTNLRHQVDRQANEEDVVLSAMASFFAAARSGKLTRLSNRRELWGLLLIIAKRKAWDLHARQQRRLRVTAKVPRSRNKESWLRRCRKRSESGEPVDPGFSPEFEAMMAEECRQLLELLGDNVLRSIAVAKLEGRTDKEIACGLGCTERTVERKIGLIRLIWAHREQR